jgi:arginyl-tRNA synthetase
MTFDQATGGRGAAGIGHNGPVMSLLASLSAVVAAAFAAEGLDPALGEVVVSQRRDLGQFQCNGALAAARGAGRSPREIATAVADRLRLEPRFSLVAVEGPGFINLSLTDDELGRHAEEAARADRGGLNPPAEVLTVVVDYAGPNVAKAMHVGHLRATIIGDSLQRIFRMLGHRVIRDPHFGDWGLQMGQVIAAIEEEQPHLPYFDPEWVGEYPTESPVTLDDLQRLYPQAVARAESDEEWAARTRAITVALQQGHPGYLALWKHMKRVSEESQRSDFAALGVEFDLWYGESDVADRLQPLVEGLMASGIAEVSDGAVVIRVDREGDKREFPPLILQTSAGAFLYSTSDLATLEMRAKALHADLVLYVVDARQSDHFEMVFRVARMAGLIPAPMKVEHIKFGTMNGRDGKPFRTRAGGVVSLRDLIDLVQAAARRRLEEADIAQDYPPTEQEEIARQVGIAALKFGDLINNRASDYVFDPDRFASFEGKTGPYVQYGAVRIKSIQRRAADRSLQPGPIAAPGVEAERSLILELLRFPDVVERAAALRSPNHVAEYAFELAAAWNRFYDACHILDEPDPSRQASWLSVAGLTLRTLEQSLDLLGIEVPERM